MKKIFTLIMCLLLSFGMVFTLFGCDLNGETNDPDSPNSPDTPSNARTFTDEDAVELSDAIYSFMQHDGSFAFTWTIDSTIAYDANYKVAVDYDLQCGWDSVTGNYYYNDYDIEKVNNITQSEYIDIYNAKKLENGGYKFYRKDISDGETTKEYIEYADLAALEEGDNYYLTLGESLADCFNIMDSDYQATDTNTCEKMLVFFENIFLHEFELDGENDVYEITHGAATAQEEGDTVTYNFSLHLVGTDNDYGVITLDHDISVELKSENGKLTVFMFEMEGLSDIEEDGEMVSTETESKLEYTFAYEYDNSKEIPDSQLGSYVQVDEWSTWW